jgi:hypothetical protein
MVLAAELAVGLVGDEGEVLGQEGDGLDEGGGMALGALDAVVEVEAVAAGFAEGVPAEDEEAGDVELLIEFLLAVGAQHTNGFIVKLTIKIISRPAALFTSDIIAQSARSSIP